MSEGVKLRCKACGHEEFHTYDMNADADGISPKVRFLMAVLGSSESGWAWGHPWLSDADWDILQRAEKEGLITLPRHGSICLARGTRIADMDDSPPDEPRG